MVLADAEGIDAEPVGQHRLLDHLADDLGVAVEAAIGAGGDIAECIEPEFHECAATRMYFKKSGPSPARSTPLRRRIGLNYRMRQRNGPAEKQTRRRHQRRPARLRQPDQSSEAR